MSDAEYIVNVLLENLDSMEGVPAYGEFIHTAFSDPRSEERRQYELRNNPPKNSAEARRLGVNWYIKNGRRYTFDRGTVPPETFYNSRTIATNRNVRRKSFGYPNTFSMRERGWPTAYRKPDGTERYKWKSPEQPPRYEI
jgi:hypothetical protein